MSGYDDLDVEIHGLDNEEIEYHDPTEGPAAEAGTKGGGVRIDYDLCESTGCCSMVCPEDVLAHEKGKTRVINMAACTSCWICVDNCVSGAIEID